VQATSYDAGRRYRNERDTLRYEHRQAAADLALAIPDAIAWCWAPTSSSLE